MSRSTSLILAALAAGAIALGVYTIVGIKPAAPAVTFVSIQGEQITIASLRGKVVLVNFWATDCVTCIREMPDIVATYNKYRAQGFETIAVAMKYDPPNYVLDYAERTRPPFKVALDPLGELARAFGDVKLTPTTFIIDRQGRLVMRILGAPDFAKLHMLLEEKLRES